MKVAVIKGIDSVSPQMLRVSHFIHDNPELGYQETRAANELVTLLQEQSVAVEIPFVGIDTAFHASLEGQSSRPRAAFLAEYDALPGIGHACGHNLICVMSVGAVIGLKEVISQVDGSIELIGSPGEETNGAKVDMVTKGVFNNVDFAMMLHPADETALAMGSLALDAREFTFQGRESHAALAPEEGVNALNAVISLFNHIDALRQHLKSDVRIHGIITEGGIAPNIVPARAQARFNIRAKERSYLNEVTRKVEDCARAAETATGAKLTIRNFENSFDNIVTNRVLAELMRRNFVELGEPVADEIPSSASTDMGNVSHVVPSIHGMIRVAGKGTHLHTPEFATAARSEQADRALILGAKVLALTALDAMTDREHLDAMKKEFSHS
jgi:amidohydrolase